MRFLKKKIAKALELYNNPSEFSTLPLNYACTTEGIIDTLSEINNCSEVRSHRPSRGQASPKTSQKIRETKNIVKNYGKAICNFAVSELATTYLSPLLEKEKASRAGFVEFVLNIKEALDTIRAFRAVLIADEEDSFEVKAYKRIFMLMGQTFINYFSVNWIFSGRITHKDAHLKFRFKMLRRIKNPENFTYIQKIRKS